MTPQVFPLHFLQLQSPPMIKVRTRQEDGALTILPPVESGGEARKYPTCEMVNTGTETHAGTTTSVGTGTVTKSVFRLPGGSEQEPVIGTHVLDVSIETPSPTDRPGFGIDPEQLADVVDEAGARVPDVSDVVLSGVDLTAPPVPLPTPNSISGIRQSFSDLVGASDSDEDTAGDSDDAGDSDNHTERKCFDDAPALEGVVVPYSVLGFKPPLAGEDTRGRPA
jgi:hypothetical protein